MAPISELLSAISKAMPYLSVDTATGKAEDHEPLLADSDSAGYLSEGKRHNKKSRQPADIPHSLRKSNSDPGSERHSQVQEPIVDSVQPGYHSPLSPLLNASRWPPRPTGHRSSSSSQVETVLRSKGPVNSDTIMQWGIITKLSKIASMKASKPYRSQGDSCANGTVIGLGGEEPKTSFRWCSSIRPNSDPDLREAHEESKEKSDRNMPLKLCSKQKAKSASTTPPSRSLTGSKSSLETQKLRRMKTVDFEEAISTPVPSQVRNSETLRNHRSETEKPSKQGPLCLGMVDVARSSPACPAVTRTDVHVIAIAPTSSRHSFWDSSPLRDDVETGPATPTMQIVESSNGSYEVIWDDVLPEDVARVRRRSSSASQALEAISKTGTKGLERVNTKLTEWSGTWNAPSDPFKPTIVVFPDDDGRRPQAECAIVDDEDIKIFAPPNSGRVSAVHSRHPSRPVSAPMSRATSRDRISMNTLPKDTLTECFNTPTEQPLFVPDPDIWSGHLAAARRKIGMPNPERKLSNIEEADMKFRNHRDSVTIAHSRLIQSGGVRPELFAHRDSVSIARKRMHAKNYATSAPRHVRRPDTRSEPGHLLDDEAASIPSLPIVKAHAAEALKNNNPASILRPSDPIGPRHIQIEE